MYVTVFLYLPEYYNPDSEGKREKIDEDKFIKTAEEIALQLSGGGVLHPHYNKSGIWYDDNIKYSDDLRIFEFDIVDKQENKDWLIQYVRDTLLKRFKQIAIYIKFIPYVEPVLVRVQE